MAIDPTLGQVLAQAVAEQQQRNDATGGAGEGRSTASTARPILQLTKEGAEQSQPPAAAPSSASTAPPTGTVTWAGA